MAAKDVKFSRDARERILKGVDILADAVKVTSLGGLGEIGRLLVGGVNEEALFSVDDHVRDLALLETLEGTEDGVIEVLRAGARGEGSDVLGLDLHAGRGGGNPSLVRSA